MSPSIFKRAIDAWGIPAQIAQTIEECCELSVALSHSQRNDRVDTQEEKDTEVLKEMADVQVMLNQMKLIFGEEKFSNALQKKINRLDEKLKAIPEQTWMEKRLKRQS